MKSILRIFRRDESANSAIERIQIIVSHKNSSESKLKKDFLTCMRQELIDVIAKYTDVDNSNVDIKKNNDILEINIEIPE